ncbi:MAG: NAD-dependent succinate-semialdehyde dehydrogenase [Caulobacterales bacterium]|jgi:succinate-semialdehyde dehydrogenase/glutarate-semialdehyde dehydrogenase|nr:NAD-dependent succinate-semialdehyde dehydrogenase [Caulobacterales bacterium]
MTYPDLHMIIDGEHVGLGSRQSESVLNPATGEALARLPHASAEDLERAIGAARRAFETWRTTAPIERGRILRRGAALMRERVEAMARIMSLEQGKPIAEARAELLYGADVIDWYAEEGRRAYGRIVPAASANIRQMVIREPVGVAAAFTPWNFPALTPCRKIGGALAAGCALVLKAAEETPGTAIEIVRALHDAGLPNGVLNLVFGKPAQVSAHLLASPLVKKISFTGSTPVGKALMKQAAEGLKRTTMELGGHAPVLVFADADVERAAALLAAAKFRNAGQVCISPSRFYVQEQAFSRFADTFTAAAKALRVGAGVEEGVTMGPLANERRLAAMERLVADAIARGGQLRTGGKRIGNAGNFFEPTVITDAPDDSLIMTEEPFGPVAPIVRFKDTAEALARANSLPFGLAAFAFTRDNATAMEVGDGLKAGMVGINSMAISTPEAPFGGVGESGHGQEGGIEGLDAYLDVKLIAQARAV